MDGHDGRGVDQTAVGSLRSVEDPDEIEDYEFSVVLMNGYISITFSDWQMPANGIGDNIKIYFPILTNLLSCLINSKKFYFKHDFLQLLADNHAINRQ